MKHRNLWVILLLASLVLPPTPAEAVIMTWVGGNPAEPLNWSKKQNWNPSDAVPTINDTVIITNGNNDTCIVDKNAECAKCSLALGGASAIALMVQGGYTLNVDGDMFIGSGCELQIGGSDNSAGICSVGGNWTNNGTFQTGGTSTTKDVIFKGTGDTLKGSSSNTFYNLSIINGAKVIINGTTDTVSNIFLLNGELELDAAGGSFTYTGPDTLEVLNGGKLDVDAGTVTSSRFGVRNGGTLELSGGLIDVNQTEQSRFESTCNCTITGGILDIAGQLRFYDCYEYITGGTIIVRGGGELVLIDNQGGFNPSGGTFILTTDDDIRISLLADNNRVYNLQLGNGTQSPVLKIYSNAANRTELDVLGNFTIKSNAVCSLKTDGTYNHNLDVEGDIGIENSGSLIIGSVSDTIFCGGDWTNNGTFEHGNSIIHFDGNTIQTIGPSAETFYNLIIDNSGGDTVQPASNLIIEKNLKIENGVLVVNAGDSLKLTDSLIVNSGTIILVGSSTDTITVTRTGAGYYVFTVNDTIAVKYVYFEYMDTMGINVTSNGTIDTTNNFSYCRFDNAETGTNSRLLTIDNAQILTGSNAIEYVYFGNAGSKAATYNIAKEQDAGSFFVDYYSGPLGGPTDELDPYNRITWGDPAGIEDDQAETFSYELFQPYPNPFMGTTTIHYSIATESEVSLRVYDISGRLVKTLINKHQEPGFYNVKWAGKDNRNKLLSNGIYFYRIEAEEFTQTQKLILLH